MWCITLGCLVTLLLSQLITPLVITAQPPVHRSTVGWLDEGIRADKGPLYITFLEGLRALGYVEGQNLVIVRRDAEGHRDRLPELAAELARLPVDVIVTTGGVPATRAAMQATTTIPIVMAEAGDPVGTGLVASLARPGANVTGLSSMGPDLVGKRLQLLKEAIPQVARVAVMYHPPAAATVVMLEEAQAAAPALALTVLPMEVRTPEEFEAQFATARRLGADAVLISGGPFVSAHHRRLLDLAATHQLPTVCGVPAYAEAGCLMAYGVSYAAMYRRVAAYVAKILTGATPADLPVEQPMKFELILNRKTAQALGITFPPTLLVLADEVIQ
jgi:putative ABC transport system substrate-binding protein